jgi:hypothetical protein
MKQHVQRVAFWPSARLTLLHQDGGFLHCSLSLPFTTTTGMGDKVQLNKTQFNARLKLVLDSWAVRDFTISSMLIID